MAKCCDEEDKTTGAHTFDVNKDARTESAWHLLLLLLLLGQQAKRVTHTENTQSTKWNEALADPVSQQTDRST